VENTSARERKRERELIGTGGKLVNHLEPKFKNCHDVVKCNTVISGWRKKLFLIFHFVV
jgi:hypothetical protein